MLIDYCKTNKMPKQKKILLLGGDNLLLQMIAR